MQLFYQPNLPNGDTFLSSEESLHCFKVLRKKVGDVIQITDGAGYLYDVLLSNVHSKKCEFEVLEKTFMGERGYYVHIGISPTKSIDRLEWFVEKATEIGIDEITLVKTKNTERKVVNIDRLKKLVRKS